MKIVVTFLIVFTFFGCRDDKNTPQTILRGEIDLLVDESLVPLIEDQVEVFESEYPGRINIVPLSENELVKRLVSDSSGVAIMSRNLTEKERQIFDKRKIIPKVTPFGRDAVVFLRNAKNLDSVLQMKDMIQFMRGEASPIRGIVLDNPNSGTLRALLGASGISNPPAENVFSFNSSAEAIKYVAENDGMVGVVALNHITQPSAQMQKTLKSVRVLSVKSADNDAAVYPSQDALASENYPLARDLYIVNCQGSAGLGVGIASFIAGEKGQRIMLKSGLLPIRIPGRNIIIRNKIQNKSEN